MTLPEERWRREIAKVTEARLSLGPHRAAVDTKTSLRFAMDHARAREAVLSELDVPRIQADLTAAGLTSHVITSAASTRGTFIRRPDLGRRLPDAEAAALRTERPVDVSLVLADGLSAVAVALNGAAYMAALTQRLAARGLTFGPIVLARQARVALGDGIAQAQGAQTVIMAIGERPGLSAADSLGIYITHHPTKTTQDSARNCISNVREAGTQISDAAKQTEQLLLAMRQTGLSGVALSQTMADKALPGD